jgi:stage II sporulation protein D
VDVENYLRGVVPVEIGRLKALQINAMKAQAVAARTYALANLGRRASNGFDVLATVEDQVYKGYTVENRLTDRAIAETHGVIATYKGRIIKTFYSSTCGGRTESVHDAWESPSLPYLKSVRDRGHGGVFCASSPVFRWKIQWNRATLEGILGATLPKKYRRITGGIDLLDLRIRKRSGSGRVKVLEIKTRRGVVRVKKDRIRSVLRRPERGRPPLRSTLFSLKIHRDRRGRPRTIIASGGGYGHGIGLCQFGAIGMANQGYRFDQILRHYYRGVKIQRVY